MKPPKKNEELISSIANLDDKLAIRIVMEQLALKTDPSMLIHDCQEGLNIVGERYEKKQYFLAGLVMGGEIFKNIFELIKPYLESKHSDGISGKVLLGTVAGDIHDLGKNIVKMALECDNFEVFDLGVDVPPELFVEQARKIKPDVVGLSGLITSAYDSMRDTIKLFHKEGFQSPIMIGGSLLNKEVFEYTGADYWVVSANTGLTLCKKIVKKIKNP